MKISVFGLGYVGTVCAACLSDQGHSVIGVDVNPAKLDILRAGRSPIVERSPVSRKVMVQSVMSVLCNEISRPPWRRVKSLDCVSS